MRPEYNRDVNRSVIMQLYEEGGKPGREGFFLICLSREKEIKTFFYH